jgi:peroxiredoxin
MAASKLKKLRRAGVLVAAFIAGLWVADQLMSTRSLADDTPATQPATTRPAVSPAVQAVLDRMAGAYATKPLRVTADLQTDFDVAGVVEQTKVDITGVAKSPTEYRHEAKDRLVVTSDGATLHLFDVKANQYGDAKIGDQASDAADTRKDVRMILLEQNPALFIALGNDPIDVVSLDNAGVELLAPASNKAGAAFDLLESKVNGVSRTFWIDHERGTIDHVAYEFAEQLISKGAAQVKKAAVTLTYQSTDFGGAMPDATTFAFAPPADATPIDRAAAGGEMLTAEPSALEGKPAADFELKDIDGKSLKLSSLKGSVVVLDFWATWCPPCRASLPHLAAAAEKFKEKGVKVFAVNQQEDRETVAKYIADQKLALNALLDSDGTVGQKFGVSGIPETVVIGRDGKIRKVFVGFDESDTNALPAAIEAALN